MTESRFGDIGFVVTAWTTTRAPFGPATVIGILRAAPAARARDHARDQSILTATRSSLVTRPRAGVTTTHGPPVSTE